MTTYENWHDVLMAFHRREINSICFELDALFKHPMRYKIKRKQSRLFILYAIANECPCPKPYKTDLNETLYIKGKAP